MVCHESRCILVQRAPLTTVFHTISAQSNQLLAGSRPSDAETCLLQAQQWCSVHLNSMSEVAALQQQVAQLQAQGKPWRNAAAASMQHILASTAPICGAAFRLMTGPAVTGIIGLLRAAVGGMLPGLKRPSAHATDLLSTQVLFVFDKQVPTLLPVRAISYQPASRAPASLVDYMGAGAAPDSLAQWLAASGSLPLVSHGYSRGSQKLPPPPSVASPLIVTQKLMPLQPAGGIDLQAPFRGTSTALMCQT